MTETIAPPAPTAATNAARWTLRVCDSVASTNTAANGLPAWHALRARVQTGGRGRTGRHWVSDEGGLWLSAVLPCPGERPRWAVLPLAAGWAVIGALERLGIRDARLRWPNDIMTGERKLAGLLLERFDEHTAVVGIGINVFNHPEAAGPELAGATARLADLGSFAGSLDELAALVLQALAEAHGYIARGAFPQIAAALNARWALDPRRVSLTFGERTGPVAGWFAGVDDAGRIRFRTERGDEQFHDAAHVSLLRELN